MSQADAPEFPFGLARQGVHEIAEQSYGDLTAATGFALAAAGQVTGPILWVAQSKAGMEHGGLFQTGLASFHEVQPTVLTVRTRKLPDALWAIEEAICSKVVGLVIAEIEDTDFTASRRLALASDRSGVPAILLMPYTKEGASAAQARWRVSAQASAPNQFDAHGLGRPRWRAVLERSRQVPQFAGRSFDIELNDETFSLNLVSKLAAHPPSPRKTGLDITRLTGEERRAG
ncbi:MAG: hypothetical protein AAFX02_05065 [Pseudomonadota bacterium]